MISAVAKQIPFLGGRLGGISAAAGSVRDKTERWSPVHIDGLLLGAVTVLALTGILLIYSASVDVAYSVYGNGFYHLLRHLLYLAISLTLAVMVFLVPISLWQRVGGLLLLCTFVLLCLVLVPGIGHEVNGSMRWMRLGPLNLQASELAKLFVVIYLAGYLVRRHEEVRSQWSGFLKPMSVMALMIVLLQMGMGGGGLAGIWRETLNASQST